ncbi:MAG: hypothetical protein LUG98_09340 [Tannerellaceae bacterium]|nr:hypothetical protein [Tannerellaceae bacterium]
MKLTLENFYSCVDEVIETILNKLTPEEMKKLLRQQCAQDASFRQTLLARYASLMPPVSPGYYRRQIKEIIHSFSDGYISYSESFALARALGPIQEQAAAEMEKGNYRAAFYIAAALYEEVTEILLYSDDSSGSISGILDLACETLNELPGKDLPGELREEIFEYLLTAYRNIQQQGWDWDFVYLYLAMSLMRTGEEKEQIREQVNALQRNSRDSAWEKENLQELACDFIRQADGEEAALNYMEANADNYSFRKQLVRQAMQVGDYTKALRLIREGVARDQKEAPGLVTTWRKYEWQVYRETGDTENSLRLARWLFLDSSGWQQEQDYYEAMKELVPAADWEEYVNGLIREVQTQHKSDYELLSTIYIREERWEALLQQVYTWPSFYRIEAAEKYLAAIYPLPLARLYGECILAALHSTGDRSHYKQVCGYFRRMIRLGAREQAQQIADELKKNYPRRKAMIEEINNSLKNKSV